MSANVVVNCCCEKYFHLTPTSDFMLVSNYLFRFKFPYAHVMLIQMLVRIIISSHPCRPAGPRPRDCYLIHPAPFSIMPLFSTRVCDFNTMELSTNPVPFSKSYHTRPPTTFRFNAIGDRVPQNRRHAECSHFKEVLTSHLKAEMMS